ncbi:MAG: hypothetical protein ABR590_02575 [Spirochaetia bacterium]
MKNTMKKTLCAVVVLLIATMMVHAQDYETDLEYAQVREVQASRGRSGTWRFDVTVEHNDTGWDHYADAWQVLNAETGEVLGERKLLHPHVNEMPFTRSLTVEIPEEVTTVRVRAKCNVHGYGGREVVVELQ